MGLPGGRGPRSSRRSESANAGLVRAPLTLDMGAGGRALRLIDSTLRDALTMGSEAMGAEAEEAAFD